MANIGLLEDNTRIAKLCATMLQYAGHQVTVYKHPRECLDALLTPFLTQEHSYDINRLAIALPIELLVLDLQLPEINGIEVLQYLQANPHTQTLPLIFCTASTSAEVARALRVAPHASVLEKPFKLQALVSTVTKALKAPGA